jgi:hypothetical protein
MGEFRGHKINRPLVGRVYINLDKHDSAGCKPNATGHVTVADAPPVY